MSIRRSLVLLSTATTLAVFGGCHSKAPEVVPPPRQLSDSAAAAVRWVDTHAIPITVRDSTQLIIDRAPFITFVGNARVLGVSELTEGTHQFGALMLSTLQALSSEGFRGLAVQAPMPEAMELDRYVRTGVGNPRQWLRSLGSQHWNTQEVLNIVEWIRNYNREHTGAEQIGFYGFELPNASHAIAVITTLPDSIAGSPLNAWLKREVQCVPTGESAAWGRDGPASDSTFWNRCRGQTAAVVDSLGALRVRLGSRPSAQASVAFAEQMARLAQHDADVGLRHLPRHQTVADHIMWLANGLGGDAKLLVWGRDVESGRLTGDGGVVQSAVPLASTLGDRYRNLAFTAGQGVVRAQPINVGQREPGGETNMRLRPARPESLEDVLNHATTDNFFLDLRNIGAEPGSNWLKGPHQARLVSGIYSESPLGTFETPLQFPTYYDGLLFSKNVTPATPLKR
ncbi:MAG TPA: erythromycin esterase family protein [Gemmatimonadaceae bacterium]|nr:erythromycin esterase family protein [Gemmatimonadaceae bacterium]